MPKVTEAHLEARRQQVLDAAVECFAANGFHQTTMQDICAKAEMSAGALYRYFGSKEEIVEAIGDQCLQRSLAHFEAVKTKNGSIRELVDDLVDAFFLPLGDPQAREDNCLSVQLWSEALRNPKVMAHYRDQLHHIGGQLLRIVEQAQRQGEMNPRLSPNAIVQVLMAMFHGLVLQKSIAPDLDVKAYVTVVKAFNRNAVWRPHPTARERVLRRSKRPRLKSRASRKE